MRKTNYAAALIAAVALVSPISGQSGIPAEARLKKAGAILEGLPDTKTPLTTDDKDKNEKAAKEVAALRRHFTELVSTYQSARVPQGADSPWKNTFSEIERTLARLIGGGSQLPSVTAGAAMVVPATTGTNLSGVVNAGATVPAGSVAAPAGGLPPGAVAPPTAGIVATDAGNVAANPSAGVVATAGVDAAPAAVATAGATPVVPAGQGVAGLPQDDLAASDALLAAGAAKVSTIGMRDLDPAIRKQLEQFRTELELFYTAPISGQQ